MKHGRSCDIQIWCYPRLKMSHSGCALVRHFQPRVHHICMSHSLPCMIGIMSLSFLWHWAAVIPLWDNNIHYCQYCYLPHARVFCVFVSHIIEKLPIRSYGMLRRDSDKNRLHFCVDCSPHFWNKKILDSNVFKILNTSNKAYWKRYNKWFRMFELFNAVSLTGAAWVIMLWIL